MVGEMENSDDAEKLAGGWSALGVPSTARCCCRTSTRSSRRFETAKWHPRRVCERRCPDCRPHAPLGKGQSVLYVGPPEARSSLRRLARVAVAAQSPDTVKIYAGLDEAGNKRSQKKKFWRETGIVAPRKRASAFASECEAVLCAHAAMAHGAEAMAQGKGAGGLGWLRALGPVDEKYINLGGAVLGGERDWGTTECRALLGRAAARGQHAGRRVADGRRADGGRAPPKKRFCPEPHADQFRAAGARKSIMDRLEA